MDYQSGMALTSVAAEMRRAVEAYAKSRTVTHLQPVGPDISTPLSVPGVTLDNTVSREPTEDGLYVVVTHTKQWIEAIPQPPTEEELEAAREAAKYAAVTRHEKSILNTKIFGGVASVGIVVGGTLGYIIHKGR